MFWWTWIIVTCPVRRQCTLYNKTGILSVDEEYHID